MLVYVTVSDIALVLFRLQWSVGAFELDMEYYLKDLLRGNPTIGAVEQVLFVWPCDMVFSKYVLLML
jgi:hypothetical protein